MKPADAPKISAPGPESAIARQVVLPFRMSVEISLKSLRVRFFRSLITVLTLVLAVAFLSFSLVTSDIARGLLALGEPAVLSKLLDAGFDIQAGAAGAATSPKERWLVILSLLVCTVGIVNAQLMAVTERFREIGTMKCLGALDSFVLRLFLLEAGFQGLTGSVAGALAGGVFALLMGLLRFGLATLSALPGAQALGSLGIAAGVGILLSLAGVLYPAIIAARMQPIEAMRAQD